MSCSKLNTDFELVFPSNMTSQDSERSTKQCKVPLPLNVTLSASGDVAYDASILQSIMDSDQELTTVTFLRVEGSKNLKTFDSTTPNMDASNSINQGLQANVNEDSMDAANAILDAASINPPVDQGNSLNENSGGSTNNPIAMLNQEQIRSSVEERKHMCICEQSENDEKIFMIFCDSCYVWYHGKCVGITKEAGKELEEAGKDWRCPRCQPDIPSVKKVQFSDDSLNNNLEETFEAKLLKENEKQIEQQRRIALKTARSKKMLTASKNNQRPWLKNAQGLAEKKQKERTCFVCEKPPRSESIFCSDECIGKHVERAKEFLMKTKPKATLASKRPELPSTFPGPDKVNKTQRVMVMEPKTNTLISASAPNAPTEDTLSTWLKNHPTFHVVMPKDVPTSKFYGYDKAIQKKPIKAPTLSIERQKQRLKEKANIDKRLKEYQRQPAPMMPTNEQNLLHNFIPTLEGKSAPSHISILKSSKTDDAKNKQTQSTETSTYINRTPSNSAPTSSEDKLQRSVSSSSIGSSEKRRRRPSDDQSTKKRRDSEKSHVNRIHRQQEQPESDFDPTPLRKNVTKGLKDALKTRVEKTDGITINDTELDKVVKNIEESLYKYYNKDVGSKYKSKYRSLVFNIKDPKNNGLFRKIIRKEYSPSRIVSMTAEEMANKELKEWRQAELKHDIEKIKSHEMEMAQIGTKLVMKTHKGDMVMEDGKESSMVELKNDDVMLPDEVKLEEINSTTRSYGIKTWEHGSHGFESQCDVCTGKITLDDFLLAKIDREKRENNSKETTSERKDSTKSSSSPGEHRRKKSREDSKRHRKSSSDHRKHSSSSRHKSKGDSGQSKDKEKDLSCTDGVTKDKKVQGATNESTSNTGTKEKFINELHSNLENKIVKDSKSSDAPTTKQGSDHRSSSHRRDSKSSSSSHKRRHSSARDKSHSSSRKAKSSSEIKKVIDKDKRSSDSINRSEKQSSTSNKDINDTMMISKGSKSGTDTSKLKGTVNDGEESTRKEVTEEDVAKAESLIKKITSSSTIMQNVPEYDNDGSEAIPTLSSDIELDLSSANDSITEIVSSTVTIKTPDTSGLTVGSDSNPIVWKGDIHMPDVAKFSVTAKQISGTTDYLTVDLKDALKIVGRIAPKTVWDYIAQISESPSKEILLVRLEPSTDDENINYTTFFNYLQHRDRLGVVGNNSKMVKDCYILPLSSKDSLNDSLLPLDGPGLEDIRPNMLLALVVRTRRKRPGDTERDAERHRLQLSKRSKNETASSAPDVITLDDFSDKRNERKGGSSISPSIMQAEIEIISPENTSYPQFKLSKAVREIQDMEIEILPEEISCNEKQNHLPYNGCKKVNKSFEISRMIDDKVQKISNSLKPHISRVVDVPSQTSSDEHSLSITAKMDQLNRQIEKQKAEIAIVKSKVSSKSCDNSSQNRTSSDNNKTVDGAGFQGLPKGIASILFGEGMPSGPNTQEFLGLSDIHGEATDSPNLHRDPRRNQPKTSSPKPNINQRSLSSLTDEDLVAKAAAQLPSGMISLTNDISEKTNSNVTKKHKYPPLLPELADPTLSTVNLLPQMQDWENSKGFYETNRRYSATKRKSWPFNKESEGFVQHDYWEPSSYYDGYDVGCESNRNWPRSGGYVIKHNEANDTWQKTLVHTEDGSISSQNHQAGPHCPPKRPYRKEANGGKRDKKNDKRTTDLVDSNSLTMEPDPRPPGEEDRSFDRSFDSNIIQRKSKPESNNENTCAETISDLVTRLSN